MRYFDPPVGAWWSRSEFWVMEGAASALGMLIGIRSGARLIKDLELRGRAAAVSIVIGALALGWLTPAFAALGRLGWNAGALSLQSRIVGLAGYDAGLILDKLLITGVYFLKTAGFALLLGLALFGVTLAAFFAIARPDAPNQRQAAS
ncbi:MAG TPA: hypothetical protein VJ376_09355 [Pseudomonadota bacterium]|nr:hypothetical protein [Pseudomonadota bacterium]